MHWLLPLVTLYIGLGCGVVIGIWLLAPDHPPAPTAAERAEPAGGNAVFAARLMAAEAALPLRGFSSADMLIDRLGTRDLGATANELRRLAELGRAREMIVIEGGLQRRLYARP